MTIREAKKAMRREVIDRVLSLTPADRERQESQLFDEFSQLPNWDEAKTVLLYASALPEEIHTRPFMNLALDRGKCLVLPVVNIREKRLELRETTDPDRQLSFAGRFGIPEPRPETRLLAIEEIDWVLVPGVAFDTSGARLGRGGGYYDRLLAMTAAKATTCALLFDEQWVEHVPVEPHDIKISAMLSPRSGVVTGERFKA